MLVPIKEFDAFIGDSNIDYQFFYDTDTKELMMWDSREKVELARYGGGISNTFQKLSFSYEDFQPEATSIKKIDMLNIPDGDFTSRIFYVVSNFQTAGGAITPAVSITNDLVDANISSGSGLLSELQLLGASGNKFEIEIRLVAFPASPPIDDLISGTVDVYYQFNPIQVVS